jgi:DNA-binding response OmpR family regulator
MVDDEPNVLSGYQRTTGRVHAVSVALGGPAGLAAIETGPAFAVVITDMRMPGMSGVEFIEAARVNSKETVFMMLTGNADQQTAVNAINRGQIFRFLNKPCAAEHLDVAIRAAIRQYELVTAERVLLRETFTGSVKLLLDALELSNPRLASLQSAVKKTHAETCSALGIARDWQMSVASALCLIGLVTVPGLNRDDALSDESLQMAASLGHRLLSNLPRLSAVAAMIQGQRKLAMLPTDLHSMSATAIEIAGAQILRFSVDLAREQIRCKSQVDALQSLGKSGAYDPRLISALLPQDDSPAAPPRKIVRTVPVKALEAGMELDTDICRTDGTLLLSGGHHLTELSVVSLRNYSSQGLIVGSATIRELEASAK